MKREYILNPENTLAILIGIDNYEDFARVDPAPSNVNELANILADEQVFGLPRSRIKMIIGGRSAEIKESLFDIFEKLHGQELETLILYFVGHGYRRPNGDYYLAAEDSKKRLLRLDGSTGIAYNTIKQIIQQSGIPQKLVFLDSCYSGSTTLGEKGMIEELRLKGTYTIASSDSREVSYFDPEHNHTLFTGELVRILRNGLAGGGERIRLDELYGALKLSVRKRNPKMSPQQLGSQEITGGNYLLCKNLQYNAQAEQRNEIAAAIDLGNTHLRARAFQKAEHQYFKARHLAEKYGLLPDFVKEIQSKIEKLRYAEELHGDWKTEQDDSGDKPQPGPENRVQAESESQANWLAYFKQHKAMSMLGLLLVAGMLAFLVYSVAGGGEGDQVNSEGINNSSGNVESTQETIGDRDPKRELTGPEIIDRIGKNMLTIRGGTFTRGCTFEQADDCDESEKPIAQVAVQDFQLNRFEVTQEEWRAVMGIDPPELTFKGCDRCPVEKVSWAEVKEFIHRLNDKTGKQYRFPSESEWEFAARGGLDSKEFKYAGSGELKSIAWYMENSEGKTHPVGQLNPNELGLYDMSGNVYEWVQDHFHETYQGAPANGEAWENPDGFKRVLRGGSWDHPAQRCRVCSRSSWSPVKRYKDVGIRLAHGIE